MLHLTRLNKVSSYKQNGNRAGLQRILGGLTRLECEALIYLGNWERIYAEFLVYIMAILSDTDFVVF